MFILENFLLISAFFLETDCTLVNWWHFSIFFLTRKLLLLKNTTHHITDTSTNTNLLLSEFLNFFIFLLIIYLIFSVSFSLKREHSTVEIKATKKKQQNNSFVAGLKKKLFYLNIVTLIRTLITFSYDANAFVLVTYGKNFFFIIFVQFFRFFSRFYEITGGNSEQVWQSFFLYFILFYFRQFLLLFFSCIFFFSSVAKFNWKLVTHFCMVVFALEWKIEISDVYRNFLKTFFVRL